MRSFPKDHCIPEEGGRGEGVRGFEYLWLWAVVVGIPTPTEIYQNLVNKLGPCSKAKQNHCYSLYPYSGQYGWNVVPFWDSTHERTWFTRARARPYISAFFHNRKFNSPIYFLTLRPQNGGDTCLGPKRFWELCNSNVSKINSLRRKTLTLPFNIVQI